MAVKENAPFAYTGSVRDLSGVFVAVERKFDRGRQCERAAGHAIDRSLGISLQNPVAKDEN